MLRSIPLWSETLGLSGRADAVEIEPGVVRPVEYKSGIRHGSAADLQLCAQALCLEEMLDVEIPDGDVWYGGPRRRVRVAFTPTLRHEVGEIIHEIRQQLLTASLPEAPNDPRCAACQLQQHCLPDVDERAAEGDQVHGQRRIPMRYLNTVYVRDHRARVRHRHGALLVSSPDGSQRIPLEAIDAVVLLGGAQVTTQALEAWRGAAACV